MTTTMAEWTERWLETRLRRNGEMRPRAPRSSDAWQWPQYSGCAVGLSRRSSVDAFVGVLEGPPDPSVYRTTIIYATRLRHGNQWSWYTRGTTEWAHTERVNRAWVHSTTYQSLPAHASRWMPADNENFKITAEIQLLNVFEETYWNLLNGYKISRQL